MKRIYIVTGASGFLGNNIIRMLEHDDNAEVRAFVLNGESISSLNNLKCSIYYGDVTKADTLNSIFEGSGDAEIFVIHCAAVVYIKSKYNSKVYDVNVNGTKNIVDKVLDYNAKLIYVSSVHAIPEKSDGNLISEVSIFNPDDVVGLYAKTKAEAARYVMDSVKDKGLNACIVHPSGILGPYDFSNSHLTALVREIVRGKLPMCVKGGYDFVDVRDVAKGIIMACDKGKKGECYIMSGEFVSIKKLADLVCDVVGKKRIKVVLPIMIAKIVAPFYEMYYLYTLSSNSNFSNEKAKRDLGFVTRDITDTVRDMVMWILGDFKE